MCDAMTHVWPADSETSYERCATLVFGLIGRSPSAYDPTAADRDLYEKEEWKLAERSRFLERLRQERKSGLLEVGAGTETHTALQGRSASRMTQMMPQILESTDMTDYTLLTLREARAAFYRRNGFPPDGGAQEERWMPFACRDLKAHLPNFKWRRRALPVHDLHHVITGYRFSPCGEFEMAAWEFAAGRYPHVLSTLFCLPLVSIGAVVRPRETFAAFARGRRSKTLYDERDLDALLDKTVSDAQLNCLPAGKVRVECRDWAAFAVLVAVSALVISSPFLLVSAIWFSWR